VVSVQRSLGIALHTGQRTDKIRFSVSASGTPLLFNMANCKDGRFCSFECEVSQNGNVLRSPNSADLQYARSEPDVSIANVSPYARRERLIFLIHG
jgi:hypothetical protein